MGISVDINPYVPPRGGMSDDPIDGDDPTSGIPPIGGLFDDAKTDDDRNPSSPSKGGIAN